MLISFLFISGHLLNIFYMINCVHDAVLTNNGKECKIAQLVYCIGREAELYNMSYIIFNVPVISSLFAFNIIIQKRGSYCDDYYDRYVSLQIHHLLGFLGTLYWQVFQVEMELQFRESNCMLKFKAFRDLQVFHICLHEYDS